MALLHQASFLYGSLLGRVTNTWDTSARWLRRAARLRGDGHDGDADSGDDGGDADAPDDDAGPGPLTMGAWERTARSDCARCRDEDSCRIRASAAPARTAAGALPGTLNQWRPVTTREVSYGEALLVVTGAAPMGAWVPAGTGWLPRPAVCGPAATARWEVDRCRACRDWRATLRAAGDLQAGAEVTVPHREPVLGGPTADWDYEVSFDGGARDIDGHRVAGAAAVLWGPPAEGGDRPAVARTRLALPQEPHAQLAEAEGCGAALRLLRRLDPMHRAARVVGDNLAVLQFGAGLGRLRRPAMHSAISGPLAALLADGWSLEWTAVRRRLNQAADAGATSAVHWAGRLRADGLRRTVEWTEWMMRYP